MSNAEKFFRDKSFPAGISDEEFKKWRHSHKGINWQQFSIEAMEEYARLKSQEENRELVEALREIDEEIPNPKLPVTVAIKEIVTEALAKFTPKG